MVDGLLSKYSAGREQEIDVCRFFQRAVGLLYPRPYGLTLPIPTQQQYSPVGVWLAQRFYTKLIGLDQPKPRDSSAHHQKHTWTVDVHCWYEEQETLPPSNFALATTVHSSTSTTHNISSLPRFGDAVLLSNCCL